jgi:cyclase
MKFAQRFACLCALAAWSFAATCRVEAQERDFAAVEYQTTRISDSLYMLSTPVGGNVGVSIGTDGVLIIDDQYEPLAPKLRAAVALLSDRPIRFVLNTHWHADHTGANGRLARTGSIVIAQQNVRSRMAAPSPGTLSGRAPPLSPPEALPIVTFEDGLRLHVNGDDLTVTHVRAAHTDGDAIVRFEAANVVHMGDVFFVGSYPFVDNNSGGTYSGLIAAVEKTLATVDERTRIIPGHGPLSGKRELQEYRDLLVTVRDRVARQVRAGRSQEQVIASRPTAEYDARWAGGFWKPEQWVARVYVDIKRELSSGERKRK